MSSTDQDKPVGKPGRRNPKGEQRRQKSDQPRNPKPDQLQVPEPDQRPDAKVQIDAMLASPEASRIDAPVNAPPISLQTIANAYGDYTRRSIEETRSFFERLKGARSLNTAMEVQTEFAKQAYETFVAQSQKIRELHGELARQVFKPLEGFVAKTPRGPR